MKELIVKEIESHLDVVMKILEDEILLKSIESAAEWIKECIAHESKVISFGNGGSNSDAQHFATELSGKYRQERPAYPAIALTDSGVMSCIANDFGYNQVFKRQLEAIGRPGDLVIALSTSGNSENVLTAVEYAERVGIDVIAITGSGGILRHPNGIKCIEIPYYGTADRIQEATILILHILVMLVEKRMGHA